MGNQASQGEGANVAAAESFDPRLEALFSRLSEETTGQDPCVTEDGFRRLFGSPLPGFASVMFNAIAPNPGSGPVSGATESVSSRKGSVGRRAFLIGAQETLNLAGLSSQIKYYHDVFFEKEGVTEEGVRNMVHTAYTLCLASINLDPEALKGDTSILDSLARSIMKTCSKHTEQEFNVVVQTHYLHLFSGLHAYVQKTLLGAQEGPHEELVTSVQQRFEGSMIDLPMAWVLSCILPIRYTQKRAELAEHSKLPKWLQWSQLYSSRQHGQSLNRFEHHVFSYKEPTVLLISCTGGFTFCVAVDSEWRESTAVSGCNSHIPTG
ncbi:Hypp5041 [Branchiostoma lanceolatum]|uniref:Hypp5041 protein n=1 Tax=Branchiostoma lanceolatum TaxID=7740 RepID=A0A8K0F3A4_BRALA|nr:Hypp5041 [Branchiostoma lanceolatum]